MNSNINMIFGKEIARRRQQLNISQAELAYRCGLHRTYIGAIERGEKSATLVTIEKLCRGLNIDIATLWEALKTD